MRHLGHLVPPTRTALQPAKPKTFDTTESPANDWTTGHSIKLALSADDPVTAAASQAHAEHIFSLFCLLAAGRRKRTKQSLELRIFLKLNTHTYRLLIKTLHSIGSVHVTDVPSFWRVNFHNKCKTSLSSNKLISIKTNNNLEKFACKIVRKLN